MAFELERYTAPDFDTKFFRAAPPARLLPAPGDGVAPDGYHAMSIFPEYFKVDGRWLMAEESRMDCVPVYADGRIRVVEPRRLQKGDLVVCGRSENGRQGIYLHAHGFDQPQEGREPFVFRQGHSRESSFSRDYDELYDLLRHEREHGKIVWVMGPAFSFDYDARDAFSRIIAGGFAHAVLEGNSLATHDLEGAYLGTALGQDIYTGKHVPGGHYHHLDTLNKVRFYGSIARFIEAEGIDNGIIYSCEKHGVPYVLAGSIRDDGPLPCVFG